MALNKTIPTNSGHDVSYLVIRSVDVDYLTKNIKAIVVGYKDKQVRDNPNGAYIYAKQIALNKDSLIIDESAEAPTVRAQVYNYLKTLPEFEGATDI